MLGPGLVVSHYRLVRRLGAGGMGEVYLAQDTSLERPVAIKFLIAPDDEHGRQRLLREARAVAALEHPHICGVYEVGTDPVGGDFIVMQYIEGESLAARLKRGRLQPEEALRVAGHVAEALQVAHRRGIIHRDLKPQNIIITPAGSPKLLDFGLARQIETSGVAAEAQTISPLTQPHAVIGTAGYMAPEQLRGRPADARTDVFALGCVLYECLTGRRAFTGTTTTDINGQALHVDPPLVSSLVPELGTAFDAVCSRLLQKAPAERLQSAEEVLGAFRALIGGSKTSTIDISEGGTSTTESSSFFGRRGLVAVIAIGIIGAAGIWATWHWHRGAALPVPTAGAVVWYDQGIEALREGAYASARDKFKEALRVFPKYVQALSRLAEAESELDNERAATQALLGVDELVPDLSRLPADDRLRLEAVRASVRRRHDQAIAAYRKIVDGHRGDSGAWLDVGRAEEAAERRKEASADYAKALELDSQSAAAHVRLGLVQMQEGQKKTALVLFDEAIRLYRAAANVEGEAEALLRKGTALSNAGDRRVAREALERAVVAAGDRYLTQRLRANFQLASITAAEGRLELAETIAGQAVNQATDAGLQSLAAVGLIEHANILMSKGDAAGANAQLVRAIQLAVDHGARRTEMRARLQQAFLRSVGKPEETVSLAAVPLKFYAEGRYLRQEADAKNIVSRAQESLEHYQEASRLANEVLQFAESVEDEQLASDALENLAGQAEKLGQLPAALAYRVRGEQIHRRQNSRRDLPFDLCNRARLLILLNRGQEAEILLAEVDDGINTGADTYASRPRTVALLRALRASAELQLTSVGPFALVARGRPAPKPDSTALYAMVLAEHALSKLGQSQRAPATIAAWPAAANTAVRRRELSYWVAQALLARHETGLAYSVAFNAWSAEGGQDNDELRWRLAALATLASGSPASPNGAKMPPHSADDLVNRLTAAWTPDAASYWKRPDLVSLRERLSQRR